MSPFIPEIVLDFGGGGNSLRAAVDPGDFDRSFQTAARAKPARLRSAPQAAP
jgi:hypothetical protein